MATALAKRPDTGHIMARPEDLPDEDLLERFLRGEARASQDAFRALVGRQGPSVLRNCRHVLVSDNDADDASQATFLVLAREGGSISDRRVLASWFREVAYRTALRARARASRRRAVERQAWRCPLAEMNRATRTSSYPWASSGPTCTRR